MSDVTSETSFCIAGWWQGLIGSACCHAGMPNSNISNCTRAGCWSSTENTTQTQRHLTDPEPFLSNVHNNSLPCVCCTQPLSMTSTRLPRPASILPTQPSPECITYYLLSTAIRTTVCPQREAHLPHEITIVQTLNRLHSTLLWYARGPMLK